MRHLPRWAFVAGAVGYAAIVYFVVVGLESVGLDILGGVIAAIVSIAAGYAAHRYAARLEAARTQAEHGREELALVGRLSATLSSPLTPPEVATQFLAGISGLLPPSVVATLLQYEEIAESIRILAQQGGGVEPRPGLVYPVGALPPGMRTKLIASLKSATEILIVIEELGVPKERVLLVLNRTTASGLGADRVARFFGRKPDVTAPFNGLFDDNDADRPLVMTSPQNAGAMVMRDLAAQIALAAPVTR